jgi:hypothetical protein
MIMQDILWFSCSRYFLMYLENFVTIIFHPVPIFICYYCNYSDFLYNYDGLLLIMVHPSLYDKEMHEPKYIRKSGPT